MAQSRVCTHAGRLPVGDRGWYVGTRPCTEERGLSLVQWPSKGHGSTTTSATRRARAASARDAPPPERCKRSGAIACAHTRKWAVLEAAAGTSEHGVAPKERGHSLVQWPFIGCKPITTSAARRTRAASAHSAPPPERERERARSGAIACAHTRKPAACWRSWLARQSTVLYRRVEAAR